MKNNLYKIGQNNQLTGKPDSIQRIDGWSIPINPDNTDYIQYLEWLADGNTPEEAE